MSVWVADWIACFCRTPAGGRVELTEEQKQQLAAICDDPAKQLVVVEGDLAHPPKKLRGRT
jgi:hypothetical protein